MEKALPFFILLAAGGAYLYFSNKKTVELFENMGPAKMPISKEQTLVQTAPTLPVEPSKGVQSELDRVKQLEQTLSLFLNKEGKRIQAETSNPSIILPLQRAYADNDKLKRELVILKNNNNAPLSLTSQMLFDMEQNLSSLRSYTSKVTEGFTSETGNRATPKQLKDFLIKVESEIIRLSASGTTEPIINRRIQQLKLMSQELEEILLKLQSGLLQPEEVPVFESDIMNSLPLLGKTDEPLPQLIKLANLPAGFQNLLPGLDTQDPEMRQIYANLLNNYKDGLSWYVDAGVQYAGKHLEGFTDNILTEDMQHKLIDGTGFQLKGGLKYISPNEVKLAESCKKGFASFSLNDNNGGNSFISSTGFPSKTDIHNVTNSGTNDIDNGSNILNDSYALNPLDDNRKPGEFDWHKLSLHICEQIRKRGMTPSDFGCTSTAPDGNWRGYTRMLCNRLGSTPDSGLPELCGCPPDNWRGWGLPRW